MATGLNTGDLIARQAHLQRDIEQAKQRQWLGFYVTLLAQGGVLFLSKETIQPLLFATLSLILWLIGSWLVLEGQYLVESYRNYLKKSWMEVAQRRTGENSDLLKIVEPKGMPEILGGWRTPVYFAALFIVTLLIITIIDGSVDNLSSVAFVMFILSAVQSTLAYVKFSNGRTPPPHQPRQP